MKLIQNWRKCLRMFSVQAMGASVAIQSTWLALPKEMKDVVPDVWLSALTVALMVLGIIGRLVVQDKISGGQNVGRAEKDH